MNLPMLRLPDSLNYIGVFLTLECNLNCVYCINDPEQMGRRDTLFPIQAKSVRKGLSPAEWAAGLRRIPFRPDLPITLQGGEPMLYWGGKGLGLLLEEIPHYCDVLTNFASRPEVFSRNLKGQHAKLQRDAPYPSIRVSYHADEMNRTWKGRGFAELVDRCAALKDHGFRVSPVKADSDVGIYMVEHPDNVETPEMKAAYEGRVPFEHKEFLGVHEGTESWNATVSHSQGRWITAGIESTFRSPMEESSDTGSVRCLWISACGARGSCAPAEANARELNAPHVNRASDAFENRTLARSG